MTVLGTLLISALVAVGSGGSGPAVQRPKSLEPAEPEAEPEAEAEAEAEAEPDAEGEPEADDELGPPSTGDEPPDVEAPPSWSPGTVEPPPRPPKRVESELEAAAWAGAIGYPVEVEVRGGKYLTGIVPAVQRNTFTLIQAETGKILVIEKRSVVSLRVARPQDLPEDTGIGLLVTGSIIIAHGGPTLISGLALVGACPECIEVHVPLLVIGTLLTGGSIPMLIVGKRRLKAYKRRGSGAQVVPLHLGITRRRCRGLPLEVLATAASVPAWGGAVVARWGPTCCSPRVAGTGPRRRRPPAPRSPVTSRRSFTPSVPRATTTEAPGPLPCSRTMTSPITPRRSPRSLRLDSCRRGCPPRASGASPTSAD